MAFIDRLRFKLQGESSNDPNMRALERYASRILGPWQDWSTDTVKATQHRYTAFEWNASTTDPTLGDGTIVARWREFGDLVFVHFEITRGSTTNNGNGIYTFTLPFAPSTTSNQIMPGALHLVTTANRLPLYAAISTAGTISSINTTGGRIGSATGLVTGDQLIVDGFYQPA